MCELQVANWLHTNQNLRITYIWPSDNVLWKRNPSGGRQKGRENEGDGVKGHLFLKYKAVYLTIFLVHGMTTREAGLQGHLQGFILLTNKVYFQ